MKTNLFVAAHKPGWPSLPEGYTVIQAGAALHDHLPQAGAWDDAGENISQKNPNYCELTALWWVAHHAEDDILGLAHYRRLFDFAPCSNPLLDHYRRTANAPDLQAMLQTGGVPDLLDGCEILLPRAQYFNEGLATQYRLAHRAEDFDAMEEAFRANHPEDMEVFHRVMQGHRQYGYNMLVARRDLFCVYADWLFTILDDVAERITVSTDSYQARVFGFLSERLMSVFVETQHLRVRELPVIFIEDHPSATWRRKSIHTMMADVGLISWHTDHANG